jgi:hypothetical protein
MSMMWRLKVAEVLTLTERVPDLAAVVVDEDLSPGFVVELE